MSLWLPRQNGKNAVIEALELYWLFIAKEPLILHSAHEYKTCQEAFLRLRSRIQAAPHLDRLVRRYWNANGEQGIELRPEAGGSRLRFIARSRGSGRGFSAGKHVYDEAQELTAEQVAAITPTLAAQEDPQVWYLGTPPDRADAWCYGLREEGERGGGRIAHFDWGADLDPEDPDDIRRAMQDRDLWYASNPSLGFLINEETVAEEASPAGLGDRFIVERLGAWKKRLTDGADRVITDESWTVLADTESKRDKSQPIVFAVDITPRLEHACIAAYALREDGLGHVEVVEHRQGTNWVVERLAQLKERHDPLMIVADLTGPISTLLVELENAGIKRPKNPEAPHRGALVVPTTAQVPTGCGMFLDHVNNQRFRHRDQPMLNNAVRGAKTRDLGNAWAWKRRLSTDDISPLVASTLALWGYHAYGHTVGTDYDVMDSILMWED
ncbi:terminase [Streptomyces sp. PA03-6a]|nr:terminase [Streptomyces sp. PA03-6a]